MSTAAMVMSTPYYVLMDGNRRIGPNVTPAKSGLNYSAIYGFSDKAPYDVFCVNSRAALKPYPLVKGYLRSQIDTLKNDVSLVVLDAVGPREHKLFAATIEVVLDAHETRASDVTSNYELIFDEESNAYRVECDST